MSWASAAEAIMRSVETLIKYFTPDADERAKRYKNKEVSVRKQRERQFIEWLKKTQIYSKPDDEGPQKGS